MLSTLLLASVLLSIIGWIHLLGWRGGFWKSDQRLPPSPPSPAAWPRVTVLIPARNEAEGIGRTVRSLLAQDYPGPFSIILVDDHSTDGTAGIAEGAADGDSRLSILRGQPLPKRWTGKLWALHQGLQKALETGDAEFLLLSDGDIEHDAANLRRLVALAQNERRDLVSLMVRLRCKSFWERLLIPPFIFFFQKIYPFSWVNDPRRREAAAAGGCVLVRAATLQAAGGIAAIRDQLIDDCALASRIQQHGGVIWLGLSTKTRSLRTSPRLRDIWRMVTRTAFAQLDRSAAKLALTMVGMLVLYAAPLLALVHGVATQDGALVILGALAWALMAASFIPTVRLYRLPMAWSLLLPVAAFLYVLMTLDSARLHWLGRGSLWKGRHIAGDAAAETGLQAASMTEQAGQQ